MPSYIEKTSTSLSPIYTSGIREVFLFPEYSDPRQYEYLSRYTPYRQIVDDSTKIKYHETFNKTSIVNDDSDSYYTVEVKCENRLDMIAATFYGYPTYWWIIAHANDIIDPFNIPVGTTLRIPPVKSLYTSKGVINK